MICVPDGPRGPELLHIMEGPKEKDLRPFWSWFANERTQMVTHAVMDMWPAFRKSFLAHYRRSAESRPENLAEIAESPVLHPLRARLDCLHLFHDVLPVADVNRVT